MTWLATPDLFTATSLRRAGEYYAEEGSANGAGKTTTLKTISGLLPPRQGRVRFGEEDLGAVPPHRIVAMGLVHVLEGRRIFNRLTVVENLQMGAYARADGAIRADEGKQ